MDPIVVLLVVFIGTLLIGLPIAWSLALSCISSLVFVDGLPLMQIAQKMYSGGEKYALMAIFFYMLAGSIMQHGGISSRLINFSKALMGHMSGGLSMVVIITCMLFAALSGSSIATTAAIGAMLYPELVKEKYPKGYSGALPVVGGTLGIVIPPSIVFVVYGTTTGTSVSKLLISGIVPGVLAGVFMCIYAYIIAKKNNFQKTSEFSWKNLWITTKDATGAILMPVIILGGIYSGIFTPTESAAVAVVYGLIVAFLVYKELTIQRFYQIVLESVKGTANILLLIMAASLFGYVLTVNNIPSMFTEAVAALITNKVTFLIFINVLLIFLGMFMDSGAIILIVAPLIYPIAMKYGIDPVHLGCIVVFNLAVGQATPPFGNCLFAAVSATKQDIVTLSKNVIPFVVILFTTVFLVSFIPALAIWLPSLMK
ncbi:TRAP transporter large permease [Petroclostridium sp. X23]|uniref:TRAP transporter large permease n=1 Tax=Petroclostridium sp. X23 TaxID=3045146 RepID=UPI0024AD0472|nr:TRAP transporter large permease [Petroclostridium sp. X23]WHH57984.1 TRAP transporter large permease [Petroclostridium sp. X23]